MKLKKINYLNENDFYSKKNLIDIILIKVLINTLFTFFKIKDKIGG